MARLTPFIDIPTAGVTGQEGEQQSSRSVNSISNNMTSNQTEVNTVAGQ